MLSSFIKRRFREWHGKVLSRPLLRFLWLECGRKNELRVRGGASKLFLFSCVFLPSPSLSPPCSLQRLFVRCLKVFAPVALKASDKKESFGIMVILQVVKRNTNERMRIDKKFKRTYNFARMLNAIHSIILDYYDFHLSSFYL